MGPKIDSLNALLRLQCSPPESSMDVYFCCTLSKCVYVHYAVHCFSVLWSRMQCMGSFFWPSVTLDRWNSRRFVQNCESWDGQRLNNDWTRNGGHMQSVMGGGVKSQLSQHLWCVPCSTQMRGLCCGLGGLGGVGLVGVYHSSSIACARRHTCRIVWKLWR